MGMSLLQKIALVEVHIPMFYEHIERGVFRTKTEVQWVDGQWRYRETPYEGDWFQVDSPTQIENLNIESLEFYLDHQLLTLYVARTLFAEPDLATRQIGALFGERKCQAAIQDAEEFGKALRELVILHAPNTVTSLKLIK